jgi:hypothetical protein
MNWINFFFGWLVKGQYEVSMLDGIMFWLEFITVIFIIILIIGSKGDEE